MTILIGLIGKRKLFSLPIFLEKIKIWIKSHPSWQPKLYNATDTFTYSYSITRKILGVWYLPESATVGGKLEAIEKNLLMLKNEIENNEIEALEKYCDLLKKLETDKRLIDSSLSDIHGRLENLAVGGITIEILGVWWLFSGLIFSSLPNEISIWIN